MTRKLLVLGLLLLGTVLLGATGLFEPREAQAFCDASISGDDCQLQDDGGTGGSGTGGGGTTGPCTIMNCQTTCLFRVECCCWYQCPSGGTWVCKLGYCANTSHSCP